MSEVTPSAGASRSTWRVVTLNIWNKDGPWPERLPLIRAQLAALEPDIIGMQEVLGFPGLPNQAEEIAEGLGWNVHYVPAWHVGGGLTFGNAILSPHRLLDAQALTLPTPAELDPRTVAFARVELPHGPAPVFCTHLTYQYDRGSVRCQQVRALADHVAALAPVDGPPPVLLADLNADPDADEVRFLRGLTSLGGASVHFSDCWTAAGRTEPGYTYDRRNPYALRSHEWSRRIDYVFVRGPDQSLRGEPLSARLALDAPTEGVWPSDHFAVFAEIWAAPRGHDAL
jgi:endonuclease/exonuclease/phosphatase family metal-dependent hydrolase